MTKEFFTLASRHLTTNGVLAYNVIGQIRGYRATLIGAMYHTLSEVFPRVYLFPAVESQNVVFVATKSAEPFTAARAEQEARKLISAGTVTLPTFLPRVKSFTDERPPNADTSPVLTDDYAPIDSLLQGSQ